MKSVCFAAIAMFLLAVSLLVPLSILVSVDVEAIDAGFTIPTPSPTPTPAETPTPTPTIVPTPTPTPKPTHGYEGGDGGGDGGGPIELELAIGDVLTLWEISSDGVLLEDVAAGSSDGILEVHILKGTRAINENLLPLRAISIMRLTTFPAPPPGYSIVCAFDFGPDGASFDPAFTAEVTIDPGMLSSGLTGSSLDVAYFNDDTEKWDSISGVFDPETRELTFSISHFTVFAVLMPYGATPTPAATPVPTPTSVEETSLTGLWVALGVVLGAGIIFILIKRRRRKKQAQGG